MSEPFTPEQEARLADLIAVARGRDKADPDATLRLACLQIAARLGTSMDPRTAADVLVAYVRTGAHQTPPAPEGAEA